MTIKGFEISISVKGSVKDYTHKSWECTSDYQYSQQIADEQIGGGDLDVNLRVGLEEATMEPQELTSLFKEVSELAKAEIDRQMHRDEVKAREKEREFELEMRKEMNKKEN